MVFLSSPLVSFVAAVPHHKDGAEPAMDDFLFLPRTGHKDKDGNQQQVSGQRQPLRIGGLPPSRIVEVHAAKLQQGTDNAHQSTTGDEAAGDERTLLAAGLVDLLILGTAGEIGRAHV